MLLDITNPQYPVTIDSLNEHNTDVQSIVFSPNGKFLASGSGDKTIKIWNWEVRTCFTLQGHTEWVTSVKFHPRNNNILASSSGDKTVKLWNLKTKEVIHTFDNFTNWVHSIRFSPDGSQLACGGADNMIQILDIDLDLDNYKLNSYKFHELRILRPYEGMNITRVKGLSQAQKDALLALGAVDESIF